MTISNPRRRKGRPRKDDSTKLNKAYLLEVALKNFAQEGYEAMSLSKLAKELNIAQSLFYYHFKNKESLWKESLLLIKKQMWHEMNRISLDFKDVEGVPLLKGLVRRYASFVGQHPDFARILLQEMAVQSKRRQWLMDNLLEPLRFILEWHVKKEQVKGNLKDFKVMHIEMIIIGAINVFFCIAGKENVWGYEQPLQNQTIENHVDAVIEIIFNGLSKNTKQQ